MAPILVLAFALNLATASPSFGAKEHLFPEFIKWHVYVVNGMCNDQNLFIRCQSKDDDMGNQTLFPGSNYTWSFKTNFVHSTLFWCYVSKDKVSTTFEVFWYDARLFDKCNWKNCIWVVKDDGIYLKDLSDNHDELRYRWGIGM